MAQASDIFKELQKNQVRPFYVIVGEEPFQISEITQKIKDHFVADSHASDFSYECFEGDHLKVDDLLASLDMLPGLFDEPDTKRLVRCDRFEKVSASALEKLKTYFESPSESSVFLITASKIDKRKAWVKAVQKTGFLVEVKEPYDRDWPRWQSYFEKKIGKKFESLAWDKCVTFSQKTLSLLWPEVQKAALYVGDRNTITEKDIHELLSTSLRADVFQFADDVTEKNTFRAMKGFEALLLEGESEVKILAILVRQFRMLEKCQRLTKKGIHDPKALASQLGTHPFFVGKVQAQAKQLTKPEVERALALLAEVDYGLKTGRSQLFEGFLTKYFSA